MKLVIYIYMNQPFYLNQRMEVVKEESDVYHVVYVNQQNKISEGWARKSVFIDYNKLRCKNK